jgi:hypothetical protein
MVFSITICYPEWSNVKYIQMPSPIYQNMVNLIVEFPIWRRPSIFMYDAMWDHHTFDWGLKESQKEKEMYNTINVKFL